MSSGQRRVLRKLNVDEIVCPVCREIFIEPVTLPCHHAVCLSCLEKTVESNAFVCPVCRAFIGSFLRLAKNRSKIINHKLWEQLKRQYPEEIKKKRSGDDAGLSSNISHSKPSLAKRGSIKKEFDDFLLQFKIEEQKKRAVELKTSEKLINDLLEEEYEVLRRRRTSEAAVGNVLDENHTLNEVSSPAEVDSTSIDDEVENNGRDSISMECRHFTPICIAPKTPPKNGYNKVPKILKPKNMVGPCDRLSPTYSPSLKNKKTLTICSNNFSRTKSNLASPMAHNSPDTTTAELTFPPYLIESQVEIRRSIELENDDGALALKLHHKLNKNNKNGKRQHGYCLRSLKKNKER